MPLKHEKPTLYLFDVRFYIIDSSSRADFSGQMGNYESNLEREIDPVMMESDGSEDEYLINFFDESYEDQDDYFLNFLLHRFTNR